MYTILLAMIIVNQILFELQHAFIRRVVLIDCRKIERDDRVPHRLDEPFKYSELLLGKQRVKRMEFSMHIWFDEL